MNDATLVLAKPEGHREPSYLAEPIRVELPFARSVKLAPVEELLRELFAETLDMPRVGIHVRICDLGGNALLSVRPVSALRRWTGLEVSFHTMFQTQIPPEFLRGAR